MALRISMWVSAIALASALASPLWAGEDSGKIGAAFGGDATLWVDPFPPEAFQEKLAGECPALLDHRLTDLRGRTVNLCAFSGKVLLVVNTASR